MNYNLLNLLNQYGVIILIIIFILINIYYKKVINILIFFLLYLSLRNMMEENNALIISYILVLVYGIVKNFHLVENFKAFVLNSNNNKEQIKKNLNTSDEDNIKNEVEDLIKSSEKLRIKVKNNTETKTEKNNRIKKNIYNLDEFMSEELINQFINKVKEVDNLLVTNDITNIYELKPVIKTMRNSKINKIKQKMNHNEINKPIVISNDNFIIDGHYRWFVKKNIIETNNNGYNNTGVYDENVKTIMIDYDIKTLIKKLKEFKIKFNEKYLSKTVLDIKKVKEGKKLIENIKNDIKLLEENYNVINKIRLV